MTANQGRSKVEKTFLLDVLINGRDTIMLVGMVIGIVVWSFNYFESKTDAAALYSQQNQRIDSVERKMDQLNIKLNSVSEDTQYIRGRIEPKNN